MLQVIVIQIRWELIFLLLQPLLIQSMFAHSLEDYSILTIYISFLSRTMSSKRKSPPNKLLDGGVATGGPATTTTTASSAASHDSLPCSNSPSINSENCGSEPDLDSYHSSSPASEVEMVRAQTATPSEGDRRHGGRKVREHSRSGSDRGNGSDNEAPLKRQKIGVDALPYNVSLVASAL